MQYPWVRYAYVNAAERTADGGRVASMPTFFSSQNMTFQGPSTSKSCKKQARIQEKKEALVILFLYDGGLVFSRNSHLLGEPPRSPQSHPNVSHLNPIRVITAGKKLQHSVRSRASLISIPDIFLYLSLSSLTLQLAK